MKPLALTPQQRRVAELVATGKTDKQVADELGIQKQAVWFHIRGIAHALGLQGGNTRVRIARVMLGVEDRPAA